MRQLTEIEARSEPLIVTKTAKDGDLSHKLELHIHNTPKTDGTLFFMCNMC